MKRYIVTEALLNAIANYLQQHPYKKVVGLLDAMKTMPVEYQEPKPADQSPMKEKQDGPAD